MFPSTHPTNAYIPLYVYAQVSHPTLCCQVCEKVCHTFTYTQEFLPSVVTAIHCKSRKISLSHPVGTQPQVPGPEDRSFPQSTWTTWLILTKFVTGGRKWASDNRSPESKFKGLQVHKSPAFVRSHARRQRAYKTRISRRSSCR